MASNTSTRLMGKKKVMLDRSTLGLLEYKTPWNFDRTPPSFSIRKFRLIKLII